jgi:nitric oxide reductase large subunit
LEKVHRFLFTLATLMFASVLSFAAVGETHLQVYITFFVLSYFTASLMFVPKLRSQQYLSIAVFAIWMVVAIISLV